MITVHVSVLECEKTKKKIERKRCKRNETKRRNKNSILLFVLLFAVTQQLSHGIKRMNDLQGCCCSNLLSDYFMTAVTVVVVKCLRFAIAIKKSNIESTQITVM